MAKQPELAGLPTKNVRLFRVNYQYAAPTMDLRSGTLMIEAEDVQKARNKAVLKLEERFGDKWHKITKIQSVSDEAPF
ncbi:hypothetical protein [Microviridae sp.]|nr:hypothetical protein [Microviridae sp.]UOF81758.1 hypothetical protein [Microviridae sp.]